MAEIDPDCVTDHAVDTGDTRGEESVVSVDREATETQESGDRRQRIPRSQESRDHHFNHGSGQAPGVPLPQHPPLPHIHWSGREVRSRHDNNDDNGDSDDNDNNDDLALGIGP